MRVIFAGTPDFARVALECLHTAGYHVPLVLTQPDRPAGRGMKLQASAVKLYALEQGMTVAQPRSLRPDGRYPGDARSARDAIEDARADAMVVAAYGLILPPWVLDAPRLGAFNIHASLLPRWRGAAPIHRAIEAGDERTGVTIMQMDVGLDTGDILLAQQIPIAPDDTTGSLHDKLAPLGGRLMVQALELAAGGGLTRTPQPAEGVTYAHKIDKQEAAIDWTRDARLIDRRIRAFSPFPGATGVLRGEIVKLWHAHPVDSTATHGTPGRIEAVSPQGLDVACGAGLLRVTELQRAGGKRMSVADFQRGFALEPGMAFEPR